MNSPSAKHELYDVAVEVAGKVQIPPLPELVIELADIEQRRERVIRYMQSAVPVLQELIDDHHYQMLVDYTLLQAARSGVDSDQIFSEIRFRYMVSDIRNLRVRHIWDALTFVRAYVEEKL